MGLASHTARLGSGMRGMTCGLSLRFRAVYIHSTVRHAEGLICLHEPGLVEERMHAALLGLVKTVHLHHNDFEDCRVDCTENKLLRPLDIQRQELCARGQPIVLHQARERTARHLHNRVALRDAPTPRAGVRRRHLRWHARKHASVPCDVDIPRPTAHGRVNLRG
eukprot:scaffold81999_cov84-Phaeocystis_antarctica.AAC.2